MARTLEAYKGKILIYIGEHRGGCCASDRFFEILEDAWDEAENIAIPQWAGIHDRLYIYTRKVK